MKLATIKRTALTLDYHPSLDLPYRVKDACNGKTVAGFYDRDDAEVFMHYRPFCKSGPDAVPPKLRSVFRLLTRQKP